MPEGLRAKRTVVNFTGLRTTLPLGAMTSYTLLSP